MQAKPSGRLRRRAPADTFTGCSPSVDTAQHPCVTCWAAGMWRCWRPWWLELLVHSTCRLEDDDFLFMVDSSERQFKGWPRKQPREENNSSHCLVLLWCSPFGPCSSWTQPTAITVLWEVGSRLRSHPVTLDSPDSWGARGGRRRERGWHLKIRLLANNSNTPSENRRRNGTC